MSRNIGFDWNRNGEADAFDRFMNMKVAAKTPSSAEGSVHKKNGSQANGIAMGRKVIYGTKKIVMELLFLNPF